VHSGVLVIADEADAQRGVPALHWSEFAELIDLVRLENEFGPFLKDITGRTPFAFVTSVRLDARRKWSSMLALQNSWSSVTLGPGG
jgi:hypothetical protein